MVLMDTPTDTHTTAPGAALHVKTRVLPGERVEIAVPGLPEGELVDVFLVVGRREDAHPVSAIDVIKSLQGHRGFQSAEEVDRYLQEERDAWDR
jgi:hypothetical protein